MTITAVSPAGAALRGTVKAQDTFSVQFIDMAGKFRSFDKSQLTKLQIEPRSLMPDDYSKRLSAPEIQNLVAYLKTLDGHDVSKLGAGVGLSWERIRDSAKEPQNYLTYWGDLGGRALSRRSIRSTPAT